MNQPSEQELTQIADFIYEAGILSKTPRSGLWFLGTGAQSVAEHLLRTAYIGYALAYLTPGANAERVVLMSMFHDLGEGRTSDLNYIHQRYGRLAEAEAIHDLAQSLPFGKRIEDFYLEEQAKQTLEAKLTKDADQLEWMATLREEEVKGNAKAKSWVATTYKRLKTEAGQRVGRFLLYRHPDDWWYSPDDQWFVDRDPAMRKRQQPGQS